MIVNAQSNVQAQVRGIFVGVPSSADPGGSVLRSMSVIQRFSSAE